MKKLCHLLLHRNKQSSLRIGPKSSSPEKRKSKQHPNFSSPFGRWAETQIFRNDLGPLVHLCCAGNCSQSIFLIFSDLPASFSRLLPCPWMSAPPMPPPNSPNFQMHSRLLPVPVMTRRPPPRAHRGAAAGPRRLRRSGHRPAHGAARPAGPRGQAGLPSHAPTGGRGVRAGTLDGASSACGRPPPPTAPSASTSPPTRCPRATLSPSCTSTGRCAPSTPLIVVDHWRWLGTIATAEQNIRNQGGVDPAPARIAQALRLWHICMTQGWCAIMQARMHMHTHRHSCAAEIHGMGAPTRPLRISHFQTQMHKCASTVHQYTIYICVCLGKAAGQQHVLPECGGSNLRPTRQAFGEREPHRHLPRQE